jgi:hypothetical protein
VNASTDVARLQAFHERVTVHAARTLINTLYKEMTSVSMRPRGVGKRQDAVNISQTSAVNRGDFIATLNDGVQAWQLAYCKNRVHIRHVVLVTRLLHFGLWRSSLLLAVVRINGQSVEAQAAHLIGKGVVVGGQDATLAGGDVLDGVQ